MARVTRIRDLQELLGFSLAEVRVVLDTEDVDVLDRVKSEFQSGDPSPERRRELLDEAIAANDQLLARLDDTLSRIGAFRDERAAKAVRLRARLEPRPIGPSPVDDRRWSHGAGHPDRDESLSGRPRHGALGTLTREPEQAD